MLISDVNMQNQIGVLDNQEKQKWFGVMGEYGKVDEHSDDMINPKGTFGGCCAPEGLYYIMM